MGDAEEIPRLVNPEKRPCVDGLAQPHSPTSMAAAVSKVFDDDNLLREIILRVGFPAFLVRAALVCKRWLCHISDRKFLSCLCKLNPPRLLGIYIYNRSVLSPPNTPHFVPMLPQPPELATVGCRLESHSFGAHEHLEIVECRYGRVFTKCLEGGVFSQGVYHPLCPEIGFCTLPPVPTAKDRAQQILGSILSKEEGGGLSFLYVLAEWIREARNFRVCVYMLQDGVWCMHTSATERMSHPLSVPTAALAGNKIYMPDVFSEDIIVLDLTASSLSRILFPHGVKYYWLSTAFSRAHDASGVYLTHLQVNELQLHIWLHKGDNWLLVHTIRLHEMLADLRMLDHMLGDEHTDLSYLCQVGDNAEFAFLKMCGHTLYLDIKSMTLRKVHGIAEYDRHFSDIFPFMMIWPPTFPALKDDSARNTM